MAAKAFLVIICGFLAVSVAPTHTAHAARDPHLDAMFTAINTHQYDDARTHAARSRNALMVRYATWMAFSGDKVEHVDFKEAVQLLKLAAEWPQMNRVQMRAERAAWTGLELGTLRADAITPFCTDHPPISGLGMLSCARAEAGHSNQLNHWITQGWTQGDFTKSEASQILAYFGDRISTDAMRARINRLLYEGRIQSASQLLSYFTRDEQTLYRARIALRTMSRNVNDRVRGVAKAYKSDPGLIFDRLRWRHKKGLEKGVYEMLRLAPNSPPYADSWWPIRALYARKSLREGNPKRALAILQKHGELNRIHMAEARWLIGWIYHSFLHDYPNAYETFYALHEHVSTPVSLARAAYWASAAAKKNKNTTIAKEWLKRAAQYPTVFYGQLALAELAPKQSLPLPKTPSPSSGETRRFQQEPLVKLVKILARHKQKDALDQFMLHMAEEAKTPERYALIAQLAHEVGSDYDAVRIAKIALRDNILLVTQGWPVITPPKRLAVDTAFALAIARQESEFDSRAKSRADARGLMQLLPRTARAVARKQRIPYRKSMLWEPAYNMVLGAHYLAERVAASDGSYVLAIASYNAGPGNVRKWLEAQGTPRKNVAGMLHWIESIPFGETRNYVQRVLENLQIYRALLKADHRNSIQQDLLR
jgi:soluble lytic murein transglycosylase